MGLIIIHIILQQSQYVHSRICFLRHEAICASGADAVKQSVTTLSIYAPHLSDMLGQSTVVNKARQSLFSDWR
jgi:hypothetical protein